MDFENKNIERLVDDLMQEQSLEAPSKAFTSNIMSIVQQPVNKELFVYKPLISKTAWLVILGIAATFFSVVYFNNANVETSWLSEMNLPEWQFDVFDNLKFNWSTSFLYASIALMVMIGFQIPILKNYLNKELKF